MRPCTILHKHEVVAVVHRIFAWLIFQASLALIPLANYPQILCKDCYMYQDQFLKKITQ